MRPYSRPRSVRFVSVVLIAVSIAMTAATTAEASLAYPLTVESTPPTGVAITSSTADGGTTNYAIAYIGPGVSVNLQAPATDPTGYTFSYWTLNEAAQTAGQKTITFSMPAGATAVAVYTPESYTVTVQSTPLTGVAITSTNADGGMTNYVVNKTLSQEKSVNLQAPATDPTGYTFSQWTVNGLSQGAGQKTADIPGFGSWGSYGTGDGQFYDSEGIATDSAGNVYVTDTALERVQKFTSDGTYVTQWGILGSGNGQFDYPYGIAVDSSGNVYVADWENNRIEKFTSAGGYVTQWGSYGSGNGQFDNPGGIAVDNAGNVYVSDTFNYRIQKFTSAGIYVTQWGSFGSGAGEFGLPSGIATDSAGNIYVADTGTDRIQKFTSAGFYVAQWGSYGSGNGQFYRPYGIATDSAGNVYVADTYNNRVQKFTSAGAYVGKRGSEGVVNGQFDRPYGIATDSAGDVYVDDTANYRIQVASQLISQNTLAVAQYTVHSYALTVQSAPPTGVVITSSTGEGGTTYYTISSVAYATSVNLQAPVTDPTGYTFSHWTVNGTAQAAWQRAITFAMPAGAKAVAEYTLNTYPLSVQSMPPTGLVITSSSADGGKPNYAVQSVPYGTTVNLVAPATDPAGYTFSEWMVNGAAQTSGQKSITFTMTEGTLAVAQYAPIYLTVQSTPPTGIVIGSSSSNNGTTDYTTTTAYGATVNLQAPATDPTGYTFSQWTVNGLSQGGGQKTAVIPGFGCWGSYGCGKGQFYYPQGIATDSAGNVYVDDTRNYRIQKFTSGGAYVTQWGSEGSGNGEFEYPTGIATDSAGNVYVVDAYKYSIQKFTSSGAYVSQWGSYGSGNGQFDLPFGIAADGAGNVYVADTENCRIQKFNSSGAYVSQWGSYGNGNGQFVDPNGIAVDGAGNVYMADTDNARIQKFTSAGVYIAQWGAYGSDNGQFEYPQGIALDGADNIYVADTSNNRIQVISQVISQNILAVAVYTPNTYTLTVQSTPPTGLSIGSTSGDGGTTNYTTPFTYGTIVNLEAPAVGLPGYTFSQWTVNGVAMAARLRAVMPAGFGSWGSSGSGNGQFDGLFGVAVDSAGDVYVADTFNNRIQKFTSAGAYVTQWGSFGSGNGQFNDPQGIALDSAGNVYVTERNNSRIQEFTSAGAYVSKWGSYGTSNGQFETPFGIARDSAGNFYVADSGNNRIQKFTSAGVYVTKWGTEGTGNGQFDQPFAIATDSAGNVYVADLGNNRIQKFTSAGAYIAKWGTKGAGNGQFNEPGGITTDSAGSVYVTDSGNCRIQKFTSAGAYVTQWGSLGSGNGQFDTPYGVTTDSAGNLYVADYENDRIQVISQLMSENILAVAGYTAKPCTLTVQSTPPTGISITSSSADGGYTNYTVSGVAYDASVDLVAPATDPAGYTFSQWTVDSAAQTPGQKSITFAMDSAVTAVAHYTGNVGYTLTVHSTPPTGQVITSSTSDGGLTNYTVPDVPSGASVNVQAPATDPAGYTFSQWTVDGAAQSPGQKSITFPMDAAVTAVAHYTSNIGYALTVQSTPPTGLSIGAGTGQGRTTNYTVTGIEAGRTVNLVAPATDPPGYTFSQWAINGAAQPAGQSISFVMDEDVTAVAQYTRNGYALTVESTPVTGLSIGSSTGRKGTTNYYTNTNVAEGTSVNLEAPATDPKGYTFTGWTVNGVSQTLGQKSITFTMTEAVTAVAWYTLNGYSLTVQSTPPTGLSIGSSTGQTGVTNYTKTGVGFGLSVNVQAPATDPAGYTFSQWTLNGAAQTDGEKSITFTMDAAMTAVAHYTQNVVYTLTVQSTPPTGIIIASSSADGGKTNYSVPGVAYGASVNLVAPATDPAGYTFSYWTVDGEAQTPGQKSIMLTMDSAVTAVAHYTANAGYTLTVQSTPPTGQVITSSTSDGGRTPYPVPGVTYGTSVNLQAPATDPAGYVFSQWKVNGAAQTPGQKSITFTMTAATTAVAVYLKNAP